MGMDIESLVREHSNELYGYLCRYTGNFAHAQDILSDVFVRLIEQVKKSGSDPAFQWRSWLYRVATNLAISHYRKQKIRALFLLKNKSDNTEHEQLHKNMETSQEGVRVRRAVESLSHRHKAVILMNVYQEMSYEEVAAALEIDIGTVKSRISIAKQRLKSLLAEEK